MLSKLIKYEFRGTFRYYLPIFALLLVVSIFARLCYQAVIDIPALEAISYTAFGLMIAALWLMTLVVTVLRFYKNLLGNEGYLMFTLPVTAGRNILAKLVPAVCWFAAAVLMTVVSSMIMAYEGSIGELFSMIGQGLGEFFDQVGINGVVFILEGLIICLLALASMILFFYLAMGIGQMANEHKFLASVGAYIGLQFITQAAGTLIVVIIADWFHDLNDLPQWLLNFGEWLVGGNMGAMHLSMITMTALCFLLCFAQFALTRYLLDKKLNLS